MTEQVEFRVIVFLFPFLVQTFQQVLVIVKHIQEGGLESIGFIENIIYLIPLAHRIFDDFVQFHILGLQVLYLQVGSDDDLVFLEHLNHVGSDAQKRTERFLESMETTFQSLDHVDTIDTSQRLTDVFGILVSVAIFRLQEFDRPITGIIQMMRMLFIGKRSQRFIETGAGIGIHLIDQLTRREDMWENDALRSNVCPIVGIVQDIVSGTANSHLVYHLVANLFIDSINFGGNIALVTFLHQFVILLNQRGEESLQIGDAIDGAILTILEQEQQVLQVIGTVVQRSGRKKHHFLLCTLQQTGIDARRLANLLQFIILAGAVATESVRFIHYNQVELFLILVLFTPVKHLRETTVRNELGFLIDTEQFECILPVIFQGRRIDHQHIGTLSVGLHKPFGYHGGNHRLSQTHHIGQEQAIVFHQHLIALDDGILLILQILHTIG